MGKIKVIFLDVDGVLNSDRTARRTQSGYTFVDNRQMKNLKHIINMTGAKNSETVTLKSSSKSWGLPISMRKT